MLCILSANHLCHNPRVIKEATTLAHAGFDVEVLGAWFDPVLKLRDQELAGRLGIRFAPVIDLTEQNSGTRLRRFGCRVRKRLAEDAFRYARWENRWQLGYAVAALGREARRSDADLFIAHSEAALAVAGDLLHAGRRIGVDMEDWFSEDLLPEARRQRPLRLLRSLEQAVLRGAAHRSCPSRAMSDALAKEFSCGPPTVIYNTFEWSERRLLDGELKDRENRRVPSVHWYSQTLGEGRGLGDLFAALPHVKHEAEIHLRGSPARGFGDWLASRVPDSWRKRVFIHGLVPNGELLSRIAEHDIGFAGEMKYCRSRDLTVTNKILHYLLAGLAVVASDTAGQREVADQTMGAVHLYPSGDSRALAKQLNALLDSPDELGAARAAALETANQRFCWEQMAPRLVENVERALG